MTVQDALERAKQLAKAREAAAPKPAAAPVPRPRRTEPVAPEPAPVAAHSPLYAPAEHRRSELPAFALRPYDLEQCILNRVLVPEMRPRGEMLGAAAYRILRTRLLQRVRNGNWTAVGLTSPGPAEGKSLTAINLALSIAAEGNNDVFLLDLDLRNPSTARYLGVHPPRDLGDFLAGRCEPQEVLYSIGIPNLVFGGGVVNNPQASELLASGHLYELFGYIREVSTRPLILVDMPPILSTDDALVVAPQVEAMLLVIGEGKTRRDGLERATELLAEFNLAGIVLNRSRETVQDYYGGVYSN
jgi:protein-tyrosine kinase